MKLYLSSFKLGNRPEKLVELVGSGKRVALILNALDTRLEARSKFLESQTGDLKKLGFIVWELDLRNYFGKKNELENFLDEIDAVWINGGNTFILRRAMKQSGFDILIKKLVQNDKIIYAGFSAAVCVATPDLHGADITDDPNDIPTNYNPEIILDGLGFVNFAIAVHYKSDHPESYLTDKEVEYYISHNIPYKTLRDGQVIIVRDNDIEIIE